MDNKIMNESMVKEQYKNSDNLSARLNLHKFNTNKQDWSIWFFDKMELPENSRILELGCGNGILWQKNIDKFKDNWDIILSDLSEGMLQSAKRNIPMDNIKYEIIDIQDIPYEEESFDVIIARHMLYHVPDIDKALSEVKRVLKPGGKFYASTNGKEHMQELVVLLQNYNKNNMFVPFDIIDRFCMENGAEILTKYFHSVMSEDFLGKIVVQQAQPVVSYSTSMISAKEFLSDEQELEEFSRYIQNEIDKKGSLSITTMAGLIQGSKF